MWKEKVLANWSWFRPVSSVGIIASKGGGGALGPPEGIPSDTIALGFVNNFVVEYSVRSTVSIGDYSDGGVKCVPTSTGGASLVGIITQNGFDVALGFIPSRIWAKFTWSEPTPSNFSRANLYLTNSGGAVIRTSSCGMQGDTSCVVFIDTYPTFPFNGKISADIRVDSQQYTPPRIVPCAIEYIGYQL